MERNNTPPRDATASPGGDQEAGIRYAGKLVRDMSDAEVRGFALQAQAEFLQAMQSMQRAVESYAQMMTIANVLAFELERRTHKIQIVGAVRALNG